MNPSVTVVIPTLNGEGWLTSSIPEFLTQDYAGTWDFLIIDSESNDRTENLFKSIPNAHFHSISRHEFGHGRTRNLALSLTQSELLLFTVQDARPMHSHWISDMVNALMDSETDAVCGGQAVPHEPNKNPLAWYRPLNEKKEVRVVSAPEFIRANNLGRMKLCGWDNVNALYKRTALKETLFQNVRFAEDIAWAKSHLEGGGSIAFVSGCEVWHYHHHTPQFTWQRTLSKLYWQHHHFGDIPSLPKAPTMKGLLHTFKVLTWNCRIFNPLRIAYWLKYIWTSKTVTYRAGQTFAKARAGGQSDIDTLYASMGEQSPLAPRDKE